MKKYAPLAVFAYNRLQHLKKTIESVKKNYEHRFTDLFIFIDGPKNRVDEYKISEVQSFVKSIIGFKSIVMYCQEKNLGLEKSIVNGVSKVLSMHDKIIVLEDDLLVSNKFLDYMNQCLELYAQDENVASIHGYVYPITKSLPDYFFLRGADCWGWGTWQRAWKKYNPNGLELYNKIVNSKESDLFDYNGTGKYLKMLEDANLNKINSWAIKWYASAFLENMYTLYPGKSFVKNNGLDGSGTHGQIESNNFKLRIDTSIIIKKQVIEESKFARDCFEHYFRKTYRFNLRKIVYRVLFFLNKKHV